jgi:hypothetical protein
MHLFKTKTGSLGSSISAMLLGTVLAIALPMTAQAGVGATNPRPRPAGPKPQASPPKNSGKPSAVKRKPVEKRGPNKGAYTGASGARGNQGGNYSAKGGKALEGFTGQGKGFGYRRGELDRWVTFGRNPYTANWLGFNPYSEYSRMAMPGGYPGLRGNSLPDVTLKPDPGLPDDLVANWTYDKWLHFQDGVSKYETRFLNLRQDGSSDMQIKALWDDGKSPQLNFSGGTWFYNPTTQTVTVTFVKNDGNLGATVFSFDVDRGATGAVTLRQIREIIFKDGGYTAATTNYAFSNKSQPANPRTQGARK